VDENEFEQLYAEHWREVLGYALRRTGSPADAADVASEVFLVVWRRRDEVPGHEDFRPWLYGVARNVLLASVRRGRVEGAACERLGIGVELDRPEIQPNESWLEGLDEALAALPPGQREAIELRVVDDLDYDGVAERLDTTPAAARVRVHRGLAALRIRLSNSKETP